MAEYTIKNRFEIRKLGPQHLPWAKAIITHSNIFHSPIWKEIYPSHKTQRAYKTFAACDYLISHQINSGLSYGVFDTQYKFKRETSSKTSKEGGGGGGGGALYWDENDASATGEELLSQMDFPLVSIAMALDQADPLDLPRLAPLIDALPFYADVQHQIEKLDTRDPATWSASAPKQVMLRNGTATRADYEGFGIMKETAHFLMRKAASQGFGAISIECLHDAVCHVWMNPPEPFRASLVAQFNVNQYEKEDEEGKVVVPYPGVNQLAMYKNDNETSPNSSDNKDGDTPAALIPQETEQFP
ncbi:conserved hypothetical protein [Talaromyces stipitatus ATCC 10500]|uniref:N-acetyltransferase domain-containing protein n=1 Tax=Talaromyces stipitatus (strain ATCC 10500 / CBS 375.48 / QM 6759 / NRRL 1006) TaxID=441959 RepID=B8MDP1_TALSN|nr:uncharacterized protein TSTA_120200 [Talaromyces stipitatus ATCC 10500]EED18270.1 conserved hypothetical protein [Talaromyces stipitatus ATCC 10500]